MATIPPWLNTDPLAVINSAASLAQRSRNQSLQEQQQSFEQRKFQQGLAQGAKLAADQIAANFALAQLAEEGRQAASAMNRQQFLIEQDRLKQSAALDRERFEEQKRTNALEETRLDEFMKQQGKMPPGLLRVQTGPKAFDVVSDPAFQRPMTDLDKQRLENLKAEQQRVLASTETMIALTPVEKAAMQAEFSALRSNPLAGPDDYNAVLEKWNNIVASKQQSVGGIKVGEIMDGYRFKGGDPASPGSWEKVQ